jgi:hypothetical protein
MNWIDITDELKEMALLNLNLPFLPIPIAKCGVHVEHREY